MAEVDPRAPEIVARLPGVRSAVRRHAEEIGDKARTELAAHEQTGNSTIEVTRGRVDTHVSLVDEAAAAIEYGHTAPDGSHVRGLRILRDAADL